MRSMLKSVPLIEGDPYRFEGASRRATADSAQGEPLLDIRFLLGVLRRRLWLVAAMVTLAVLIAIGLYALTPPTFESDARVVLDSPQLNPFGDDGIFVGAGQGNPEIESQIQIIRSPYTLAQVVDNLNLDESEEFLGGYRTPAREWVTSLINRVRSRLFGASGEPDLLDRDPADRTQEAVDRLKDNLSVTRVGLTYVLNISYTSNYGELSADIANGVAEVFIQERIDQRQAAAVDASEWFTERLAELNAQALDAERRVAEFRAASGIFEAGNAGQLDEQQLASLNEELTLVLREAEDRRARMDQLEAILEGGNFSQPLPSTLSSATLDSMFERRQLLVGDRVRFELANGADHPATLDLAGRIASLDAEIAAEVDNLFTQSVAEHEAAQVRVRSVQERYDLAIGGARQMSQSEVQLQALVSEADVYRQLHDEYLQSYLQTIQQQSFPSAQASIIQVAVPRDFRTGPGLSLMVIVAGTIGLAGGVGTAFALEFMDRRIRSRAQLTAVTNLPNLGVLPKEDADLRLKRANQPSFAAPSRRKKADVKYHELPVPATSLVPAAFMTRTIDDPVSLYSETLRKVRVEIERETSGAGNTVVFLADVAGSARSVAAVNYAEMLALGGARTLLIDLDWRQSFLTETLAPNAAGGLADYIASGYQSQSAEMWTDERTGLQFLPNRSLTKQTPLDASILDTERLKIALERLSTTFRYIVVDVSSLAESSDASALADRIDAYVLVAAWGETRSDSLEAQLARATVPRDKMVGTVLANVDSRQLSKYEHI